MKTYNYIESVLGEIDNAIEEAEKIEKTAGQNIDELEAILSEGLAWLHPSEVSISKKRYIEKELEYYYDEFESACKFIGSYDYD